MAQNKCSFCASEDDVRKYLVSDDGVATVCSNCALMFAQYMLDQKENDSSPDEVNQGHKKDDTNKNEAFYDYLVQLEEKWMEKNVVNSYILQCGGVINEVHFRFEDQGDEYYFVCELEVEGIDSVPGDVEEKILNEIEWAFDEIRDELEEQGLDLESSLGEKLVLTRVDQAEEAGNSSNGEEMSDLSSNEELNELCDAIADKLMETGYLTSAIEEGDLATVSIALEGDQNSFRVNINVQIDDRDSDELSDDEEEALCDGFQFFIQEKQLESSFADLGFDLDDNCDGYSAYLVG